MSRSARVTFDWADGTYEFRLPIDQLVELEEKTGVGLPVIYKALTSGTWTHRMVREVIRLGLIGGRQVPPPQALQLVRRYVDERPWQESVIPATVIISAALVGVEDEPMGGAAGEGLSSDLSPTSAPAGPTSTAPEPPSA